MSATSRLMHYQYQSDEIAGLLRLRINDAMSLFSGGVDCVKAAAVGLDTADIALTREDFIKSVDNYVMKILILAGRYFAGEKELWI